MTAALTVEEARRLAVRGQLLPRRGEGVEQVVRQLGYLQLDPTNVVARSHLLVLHARLGHFDPAELAALLGERRLYEYSAAIVAADDYAIHRHTMRDWPHGPENRRRTVDGFIAGNGALRRHVLRELRRRGPLRGRELEDLGERPWRSSGWTNERNVDRMLEFLAMRGQVLVAGRQGQERLWDLGERVVGPELRRRSRLTRAQAARRLAERSLRALGVAAAREVRSEYFVDNQFPGVAEELATLERRGTVRRVRVEGLREARLVHADDLEALDEPAPAPRAVLLSPFDMLIRNRARTEALFGFHFRLEIYVPREKRRYGFFVLPVLYGDRLVGRIDPALDRAAGALRVHAVHAEPEAPEEAGPALRAAVAELAAFLEAREVAFGFVPAVWRESLEDVGAGCRA